MRQAVLNNKHSFPSATSCLTLSQAKRYEKKCLAIYNRDAFVLRKPLRPCPGIPGITSQAFESLFYQPRISASWWVGILKQGKSPDSIRVLLVWNSANSGKQLWDAFSTNSSVNESLFEMGFIVAHVTINFCEHRSVRMPHDGRDSKMIMPLNEFARSETVTRSVHKHTLANQPGEMLHAITDSILAPGRSSAIPKEFAFSDFAHKPGDNFQSSTLKIDDTLGAFSFGFFCRKDNAFLIKLHMAGFDVPSFLRTRSCEPTEYEEITERIGFRDILQDFLEIRGLHINLAALGRRLWNLTQRSGFKVSHLHRPVIDALNSYDGSALIVVSPPLLTINPLSHMKWLKGGRRQFSYARMLKKAIEIVGIPFARTRRTMFAAPGGVLGCQRVYCKGIFHLLQFILVVDPSNKKAYCTPTLQQVWLMVTEENRAYKDEEILGILALACYRAGGVRKWSKLHNCSHSSVSRMLKGTKPLSPGIAKIFGLETCTIWRLKEDETEATVGE